MSKQRIVTLSGGADYTIIRASMPCHTLRVYQDGVRDTAFIYKKSDDGFVEEYTTQAGDQVQVLGHGRSGIIGRPPGYNGWNSILGYAEPVTTAPATGDSGGGDIILYIKSDDGSSPDVVVVESESEL